MREEVCPQNGIWLETKAIWVLLSPTAAATHMEGRWESNSGVGQHR